MQRLCCFTALFCLHRTLLDVDVRPYEVVLGELPGGVPQLQAGLAVGEQPDPDTVGGVQQLGEERAAGLDHRRQLQFSSVLVKSSFVGIYG